MPECQYCGTELDDRYNFCLNCDRQVKCTNCGEILVRDKRICFVCGQPLLSETSAQNSFNEFTLEENQTEKSAHRLIKGRFSDDAVAHAATLLGGFTRSRPVAPQAPASERPALTPLGSAEEQTIDQNDDGLKDEGRVTQDTVPTEHEDGTDKGNALKLFKQHGDNDVIPKLVDFKGSSWKEQQRRFIVLYVWAYNEILGHPVPSRDNVIEAAKKASNIYDVNNTRKYYREVANELLLGFDDHGLELNPRGLQFVEEVITDIEDSSVDEGFVYWKAATKPTANRSRINKKDEQVIDEWVDKPIDIGDFDVRGLSGGTQWAMFALWSITERLQAVSAVKPVMGLQYLIKRYRTVPIKQKAFSMALLRNNDKFHRTADGSYYLTPQAQRQVETWISEGKVDKHQAQ